MPPLHRAVADFDDEDAEGIFLPLDRRWSDASEASAYSIQPNDQALQVQPLRALETKKVAVIGNTSSAVICASVLQQDGHQVTVVSNSDGSNRSTQPPLHLHPDFPPQANHITQQSYDEDCADHFGVVVRHDMKVTGMTEKYGGVVLTMQASKQQHSLHHEFFDFVVVTDDPMKVTRRPNRLYHQYLLPVFLAIAAFVCTVLGVNLCKNKQSSTSQPHTVRSILPAKYRGVQRLYRRMLAWDISSVAFIGGSASSSTYLSSIWLSAMLHGELLVPEQSTTTTTASQQLSPFALNDLLLQDMGLNPMRKDSIWEEMFGTYTHNDYQGVLDEIQKRRQVAAREGWGVPLTPVASDL